MNFYCSITKKSPLPVFLQLIMNRPANKVNKQTVWSNIHNSALLLSSYCLRGIQGWKGALSKLKVRPSHTLSSVICYVMHSPIATSRYLLALLLASPVELSWTERQDGSIPMFCLCAGRRITAVLHNNRRQKSQCTLAATLKVSSY